MNPGEDREVIGQAIYTWSTARLDRTPGMGFSAISPSLEASVDWLAKLQPQEFKLFRGEVTGQADLYAARKGFSEIGRLTEGNRAIIFCKTADGALDAKNRPQPWVHGLVGSASTLGLSCALRINGDFWFRKLDKPDGMIQLSDLTMSDVLLNEVPIPYHDCNTDHKLASDILRLIAGQAIQDIGTFDLPANVPTAIIFLAFPEEIAERFSLDPYVTVEGLRRQVRMVVTPQETGVAATPQDPCFFQQAVEEAASRFLRQGTPQLGRYAQAVLEAGRPPSRSPGSSSKAVPSTTIRHDVVHQILYEIRTGGGPLTQVESERMLERLRRESIPATSVTAMPIADLINIFAHVEDERVLVKWARYFTPVKIQYFADLWNRTHVSAFLGLVLVQMPSHAGSETFELAAERGISPEITTSILRSMRRRVGGGQSIAQAIMRGLGATDSMRTFIAGSFQDDPAFLFDTVLRGADIPENHVMDYIRVCYWQWVAHRRLPSNEAKAIENNINRLTLLQKLTRIIRPGAGSGGYSSGGTRDGRDQQ